MEEQPRLPLKTADEDTSGQAGRNERKIEHYLKNDGPEKYIDMDDPDNANFCLIKGFLHRFGDHSIYYEYDRSRALPEIENFFS